MQTEDLCVKMNKSKFGAVDLLLDEGAQRKVVKEVGEPFPHIWDAVLAETFVVEAVSVTSPTTYEKYALTLG